MRERAKGVTIAVCVTILDVVVVWHYVPVIWQVWGGIPGIRVCLLLLAGTGSFTLADIWVWTLNGSIRQFPLPQIDPDKAVDSLPSEILEGADV